MQRVFNNNINAILTVAPNCANDWRSALNESAWISREYGHIVHKKKRKLLALQLNHLYTHDPENNSMEWIQDFVGVCGGPELSGMCRALTTSEGICTEGICTSLAIQGRLIVDSSDCIYCAKHLKRHEEIMDVVNQFLPPYLAGYLERFLV